MNASTCHGQTALGPCDKPAKYVVNDERACGVHLAQLVKFHLRFQRTVTVQEVQP